MLFRENTCEEFIDSLSYKDLQFMKELLKELANQDVYEQIHYQDGQVGFERCDNSEMIRAMIHSHYAKEREKKQEKKRVIGEDIKKLCRDIRCK